MSLLPIPVKAELPDPPQDEEAFNKWIKDFYDDYKTVRDILLQDINRLSVPPASNKETPARARAGQGVGVSQLTGDLINMLSPSFKMGLQLSNGADRGKVNVAFQYIGIGPVVVGNGVSQTLTADVAVAGVNGLDTGSEASSTWYAVHVITQDAGIAVDDTGNAVQPPMERKQAKVATLLSTSATAPVLPVGYNRFRRVGYVYNDGSSNFNRFIHQGDLVFVDEAGLILNAQAGTGGAWNSDLSLAAFVAPSARFVFVNAHAHRDAAGAQALNLRPAGGSDAAGVQPVSYADSIYNIGGFAMCACSATQTIDWLIPATGTATLVITGYYDPV